MPSRSSSPVSASLSMSSADVSPRRMPLRDSPCGSRSDHDPRSRLRRSDDSLFSGDLVSFFSSESLRVRSSPDTTPLDVITLLSKAFNERSAKTSDYDIVNSSLAALRSQGDRLSPKSGRTKSPTTCDGRIFSTPLSLVKTPPPTSSVIMTYQPPAELTLLEQKLQRKLRRESRHAKQACKLSGVVEDGRRSERAVEAATPLISGRSPTEQFSSQPTNATTNNTSPAVPLADHLRQVATQGQLDKVNQPLYRLSCKPITLFNGPVYEHLLAHRTAHSQKMCRRATRAPASTE